jgi:hypothetical protein
MRDDPRVVLQVGSGGKSPMRGDDHFQILPSRRPRDLQDVIEMMSTDALQRLVDNDQSGQNALLRSRNTFGSAGNRSGPVKFPSMSLWGGSVPTKFGSSFL